MGNNNQRYSRTIKGQYTELKRSAKRRNISLELSVEELEVLRQRGICHYCNQPLPATSSGIDRINNAKGYSLMNCVPCCTRCNAEKGPHFTYEEYMTIWLFRQKKIKIVPL